VSHIAEHAAPFHKVDLDGVERSQIADDAIARRVTVCLGHEAAEQPIPDDHDPGVVGIEISWIGRVMDPVMAGRIEDLFKGAHTANLFRVDPELVNEANALK
jgi:hypothetical protein